MKEILAKLSSSEKDANGIVETLHYAYNLIPSKAFRGKALELIAGSLMTVFVDVEASASAKRNAVCTLVLCRQLLGDATSVGEIITQLVDATDDGAVRTPIVL